MKRPVQSKRAITAPESNVARTVVGRFWISNGSDIGSDMELVYAITHSEGRHSLRLVSVGGSNLDLHTMTRGEFIVELGMQMYIPENGSLLL